MKNYYSTLERKVGHFSKYAYKYSMCAEHT